MPKLKDVVVKDFERLQRRYRAVERCSERSEELADDPLYREYGNRLYKRDVYEAIGQMPAKLDDDAHIELQEEQLAEHALLKIEQDSSAAAPAPAAAPSLATTATDERDLHLADGMPQPPDQPAADADNVHDEQMQELPCPPLTVHHPGLKRPSDEKMAEAVKRSRRGPPPRSATEDDITYSFRVLSHLAANGVITEEQKRNCRRILINDLSKGLTASLMEYVLDQDERAVAEFVDFVSPRPPSLCQHIVQAFKVEIKRLTLRTVTTKLLAGALVAGTTVYLDLKKYI